MRVSRFVVIVAAFTGIGLAAVGMRAQTTRLGYEIAAERARQRELLEERARLRFDLAALSTPGRVLEGAAALQLRPAERGPVTPAPPRRPADPARPRLAARP